MILVTLGTQDKQFKRLIVEIDRLIEKKVIKDKVTVQAGSTKYESKNMEIFDLIPKFDFEKLIKESDYIITHGGVGTILTALKSGKRVIGVSRLSKYNEVINDHQIDLIPKFTQEGYIIGVNEIEDLEKAIVKINSFKPRKYKSDNKQLLNPIRIEIEQTKSRKYNILFRLFLFFILVVVIIGVLL